MADKPLRILLADDKPQMRRALRALLFNRSGAGRSAAKHPMARERWIARSSCIPTSW